MAVIPSIVERGKQLEQAGFGGYYALHLACAEKGQASVFLTVDDGIISKARRSPDLVRVIVMNPVTWFMERMWQENAGNDNARN